MTTLRVTSLRPTCPHLVLYRRSDTIHRGPANVADRNSPWLSVELNNGGVIPAVGDPTVTP